LSQRNCEPFTPLLSRLLQEQEPRVPASSAVPALPDFASGTRSSSVFFDSTLHGWGSDSYTAACTVGEGLADADADADEDFALSPAPSSEPESEEQPAATSITGTTAAPTRTRRRPPLMRCSPWSRPSLPHCLKGVGGALGLRSAARCMVPSLMTDTRGSCGRIGSEGPRYAVKKVCGLVSVTSHSGVRG
jgi:hypothetical protein